MLIINLWIKAYNAISQMELFAVKWLIEWRHLNAVLTAIFTFIPALFYTFGKWKIEEYLNSVDN